MLIAPIQMQDLKGRVEVHTELLKDSMLEKVSLICINFFCISTEIRFLLNEKNSGFRLETSK